MKRTLNPFNATLSPTPPYLAGRQMQIADFEQALLEGPGAHERVSLISGPRGVGKTVLLNAFEDKAREHSWWVISDTATPGFMQRMTDAVVKQTRQHCVAHKKVLTGVSVASLGGLQVAQRKLWLLVHEPALADISSRDRDFLVEMARNPGATHVSELAQRLGVDAQYVGTYRRRLIQAELIESAGYGLVDFSLPYLREYLQSRNS